MAPPVVAVDAEASMMMQLGSSRPATPSDALALEAAAEDEAAPLASAAAAALRATERCVAWVEFAACADHGEPVAWWYCAERRVLAWSRPAGTCEAMPAEPVDRVQMRVNEAARKARRVARAKKERQLKAAHARALPRA